MTFPSNYFAPTPLKKLPEIFLMTSDLDSHTATDVKSDMLSGVKTGNGIPHSRYTALPMHAQTKKQHCHAKMTRANLYMYIGLVKNQDRT